LLLAGLIGVGRAKADPRCESFQGFAHCALGTATLEGSANGLTVKNRQRDPKAGVSIDLPSVHSWRGQMNAAFPKLPGDVLRAASISDGVATSHAQLRRVSKGFAFSSAFTGSVDRGTYRLDVLLDGVTVGSTVLPSILNPDPNEPTAQAAIAEYDMDVFDGVFIVQPNGACQWDFAMATAAGGARVTLPTGLIVMGNEIRMTEIVNPSGGYPYVTFDGLAFQGSFDQLGFRSESVQ
jgi:hypothetical protein